MQPWEEASPNQTAVPFERKYLIRDTETPILKQNIGMFRLKSGAEIHFQSFGIFNLELWDDVMAKFMPLSKKDIVFVGKSLPRATLLRSALQCMRWQSAACTGCKSAHHSLSNI